MAEALDDLVGMAVFAHVVRTRSFSAAARELGLSKSAASRAVSRLEERLGVPLLHRTTRRIGLTPAGEELYARAQRIVEEADDAGRALLGLSEAPRGLLRVNAPVVFGERFVARLLPEFLALHPDVRVEITLVDRMVDLVEEGVDVAIRIARLADAASLVARRIGPDRRVVVASPAYLDRRGRPEHPRELSGHDCLRYSLVAASEEWRFQGPEGEFSVEVRGPLASNNGTLMAEAVRAGVGLALLPWFIAGDDVRAGRLEVVLEAFEPPIRTAIWAVYPQSRQRSPAVRAFVEFMAARLCDAGAPP
jgi:DNA-binding transcriptional LysR family regulator